MATMPSSTGMPPPWNHAISPAESHLYTVCFPSTTFPSLSVLQALITWATVSKMSKVSKGCRVGTNKVGDCRELCYSVLCPGKSPRSLSRRARSSAACSGRTRPGSEEIEVNMEKTTDDVMVVLKASTKLLMMMMKVAMAVALPRCSPGG